MENASFQNHVVDLGARELEFLNDQNFVPADVRNFKHVLLLPLCQCISGQLNASRRIVVELVYWIDAALSEGDSVEMGTSESSSFGQFYWPCRVLSLKGYYVLLKPESITEDSEPIWAHLLSVQIFPAGYSVKNKVQPRKPNNCFTGPETTNKDFVAGCYVGVPSTFPSRLRDILRERLTKLKLSRPVLNPQKVLFFKKGMQVEVRDPEYLSYYHVGRVRDIVGTRVAVTYNFRDVNNELFSEIVWCDKESDTVQPCGWCKTVGHSILCDDTYSPNELDTAGSKYENFDYGNIETSQRLEVIYPLDRSRLYLATVTQLLKFGYVMIRVEVGPEEAFTEFCVHLSSPEIFPLGFADRNEIERAKPAEAQPLQPVPELLLRNSRNPPRRHCFARNMKLEASEWFKVDGNEIYLATVTHVVSDGNWHLLKISYDDDEREYHEQWVAPSSCDIYPYGYSHLSVLANEEECLLHDRALNPFEWTCQDLKQFLERSNYWASSLLKDILPDSIDGKTLTSCTETDVGRMAEHYQDARSKSSCLESLVNLINYLRVLHCGYQM